MAADNERGSGERKGVKFGISSTICRVLKWRTKRSESMAAAEGFLFPDTV